MVDLGVADGLTSDVEDAAAEIGYFPNGGCYVLVDDEEIVVTVSRDKSNWLRGVMRRHKARFRCIRSKVNVLNHHFTGGFRRWELPYRRTCKASDTLGADGRRVWPLGRW